MALSGVGSFSTATFSNNTAANVSLTGVTVGNMLVGLIAQSVSNSRTFGISDGANTWTQRQRAVSTATPTDQTTECWTAPVTTGGNLTEAFSSNANTTATVGVREVTGSPSYDTSGKQLESSDSTSHTSSSTGLTIQAGGAAWCTGVLNASGVTTVAGANYTKIGPTDAQKIFQEVFSAGGLASNTGPWSNTSNNRHSTSVMVVLAPGSTPPPPPSGGAPGPNLPLLGAGPG